jgi:hypothetical protein
MYLSDKFSYRGSLNNLIKEIENEYGVKIYYPNAYKSTKKLKNENIINYDEKNISLNLDNTKTLFYMSIIEEKKLISSNIDNDLLNDMMDLSLQNGVITSSILEYKEFDGLNRIEFLILTNSHDNDARISKQAHEISLIYNTAIDPIILTPGEFYEMLTTEEFNHVKRLIGRHIIIYNSEGFWSVIKKYRINEYLKKNDICNKFIIIRCALKREELAYNYNRFGFALIEDRSTSPKISLEDTIFLMATNDEPRIKYGTFVVLLKNISALKGAYLFYLFRRYGELKKLKGILINMLDFYKGEYSKKLENVLNMIYDTNECEMYEEDTIKRFIDLYNDVS